jgi:hypothetical protein
VVDGAAVVVGAGVFDTTAAGCVVVLLGTIDDPAICVSLPALQPAIMSPKNVHHAATRTRRA